MAALTIDEKVVRPVIEGQKLTAPATAAIKAGELIHFDATTGLWVLGNATDAAHLGDPYVAGNSALANFPVTGYKSGTILELGTALDALNFDAAIYANDADGSLGTTAGTVSAVIGRVVPGFGNTTAEKLLRISAA